MSRTRSPEPKVQSASSRRCTPVRGRRPASSKAGKSRIADDQHEGGDADQAQRAAHERARRRQRVAHERPEAGGRQAARQAREASQAIASVGNQRQQPRSCHVDRSVEQPFPRSRVSLPSTLVKRSDRDRIVLDLPAQPHGAGCAGWRGSPRGRRGSRAAGCRRGPPRSAGSAPDRCRSRPAWS